jgi:hypothetical protein
MTLFNHIIQLGKLITAPTDWYKVVSSRYLTFPTPTYTRSNFTAITIEWKSDSFNIPFSNGDLFSFDVSSGNEPIRGVVFGVGQLQPTITASTTARVFPTYQIIDNNNVWMHYALALYPNPSNLCIEFYRNGSLLNRQFLSISNMRASNASLFLGHRRGITTDNRIDYRISDFRIWNLRRTQTQIADNMDDILAGQDTGLISRWLFDEGTGTTATNTGGGSNGTVNASDWNI